MRYNETIKRIQRTHTIALIFIVVFQIISLVVLNLFLGFFLSEIDRGDSSLQLIILAAMGGIFVLCDVFFCYKKIWLLQALVSEEPVKCRIEDFLLLKYYDDNLIKYNAHPIIRSLQNDKLYFTYGIHSLADFNMRSSQLNNSLIDFAVYSDDGLPIKVGDVVYMYSLKTLDVTVAIDHAKNCFQFNRKKYPFYHVNESFKIDELKDLIFFQGVVDTK